MPDAGYSRDCSDALQIVETSTRELEDGETLAGLSTNERVGTKCLYLPIEKNKTPVTRRYLLKSCYLYMETSRYLLKYSLRTVFTS